MVMLYSKFNRELAIEKFSGKFSGELTFGKILKSLRYGHVIL